MPKSTVAHSGNNTRRDRRTCDQVSQTYRISQVCPFAPLALRQSGWGSLLFAALGEAWLCHRRHMIGHLVVLPRLADGVDFAPHAMFQQPNKPKHRTSLYARYGDVGRANSLQYLAESCIVCPVAEWPLSRCDEAERANSCVAALLTIAIGID